MWDNGFPATGPILPVVAVVDAVFFCLVRKLADCCFEDFGSRRDVAPGVFKGIDDHFPFEIGHGILQ